MAETERWLGEVEGLQVSLVGAEEKLRQLDRGHGRHQAVCTGMVHPSLVDPEPTI